MKITKIGHCCLLLETDGKRIMTDPGAFTAEGLVTENIDIVVITHEHGDHFHIDSLKKILASSPEVTIIANQSVGRLLADAGIAYELLQGTSSIECKGVSIAACDSKHEEIFQEIGQVQNTGYFIAGRLFYGGDSYAEPGVPVDILALPVGGPWCKVGDAIRYALKIHPKKAFPVHDGIERQDRVQILHATPQRILSEHGIDFRPMKAGDVEEF